jgi:hypothetical protein
VTARYWYTDNDGNTVTMEWRPVTDEDRPLEPGEPEPVEEPDEPDDPDIPQPKTDEPEE